MREEIGYEDASKNALMKVNSILKRINVWEIIKVLSFFTPRFPPLSSWLLECKILQIAPPSFISPKSL